MDTPLPIRKGALTPPHSFSDHRAEPGCPASGATTIGNGIATPALELLSQRPSWMRIAAVFCRFLLCVLPILGFAGYVETAAQGLVAQTHVISIHVPDHAAFDAVFVLLQEDLQLPKVYGEMSRAQDSGKRLYAGFSLGNAYLEPCGPYPSDAPFEPHARARFHGLTCTSTMPLDRLAAQLSTEAIRHSGILGNGDLPRFIYLSDEILAGPYQAVSFWSVQRPDDPVQLAALQSSLAKRKGGVLGVQRLKEILIGCRDQKSFARWSRLLSGPSSPAKDRHLFGDGPHIILQPARENSIGALVLQVASMSAARSALKKRGWSFTALSDGRVELDVSRTFGLRFILSR